MLHKTLLILLLSGTAALADERGALYAPSANPMAEVDAALERARQRDRHALIVLGANWCHDSRALAAQLHEAPLEDLIANHYELVLVSVGYYESGIDVTRRFGVPTYYATPTVLIVDAETEQLLNADDRHRWGAAASIGRDEALDYFTAFVDAEPPATPAAADLTRDLAAIDALEAELAARVIAGYAVVGPMLRDYKNDNAADDFDARWDELAAFRMAIPETLDALRAEARERSTAGDTGWVPEPPRFDRLSWEAD